MTFVIPLGEESGPTHWSPRVAVDSWLPWRPVLPRDAPDALVSWVPVCTRPPLGPPGTRNPRSPPLTDRRTEQPFDTKDPETSKSHVLLSTMAEGNKYL